ncbi:MAG: ribosome maturation factor RimM [Cyanobacteria bacterium J06642_2]
MAEAREEWLIVGKVVGAHGLRGIVKILSFSDFPERFTEPGARWLRPAHPKHAPPVPVQLQSGEQQPGKNVFRVRFDAIRDRTEAEAWVGSFLMVPASDRPHLEEGEFLVSDLIGLTVFERESGRELGRVTDVLPSGHDILEITWQDTSYLIPFVEAFVPIVDLDAGRVEITPLPGMLPDELTADVRA